MVIYICVIGYGYLERDGSLVVVLISWVFFLGFIEVFFVWVFYFIVVRKDFFRVREMLGFFSYLEVDSYWWEVVGGITVFFIFCILIIVRDLVLFLGKIVIYCFCGWFYSGLEVKEFGLGKGRVGSRS